MIRLDPGGAIGIQCVAAEQGGVAVNGAAAEKLQLIQHLPIAGNGGHAVHDLP